MNRPSSPFPFNSSSPAPRNTTPLDAPNDAIPLGQQFLQSGLITQGQLAQALREQHENRLKFGEICLIHRWVSIEDLYRHTPSHLLSLGEVLVALSYLEVEQLKMALAQQRRFGRKLGEILLWKGWLTEETLKYSLSVQQYLRQLAAPDAWEALQSYLSQAQSQQVHPYPEDSNSVGQSTATVADGRQLAPAPPQQPISVPLTAFNQLPSRPLPSQPLQTPPGVYFPPTTIEVAPRASSPSGNLSSGNSPSGSYGTNSDLPQQSQEKLIAQMNAYRNKVASLELQLEMQQQELNAINAQNNQQLADYQAQYQQRLQALELKLQQNQSQPAQELSHLRTQLQTLQAELELAQGYEQKYQMLLKHQQPQTQELTQLRFRVQQLETDLRLALLTAQESEFNAQQQPPTSQELEMLRDKVQQLEAELQTARLMDRDYRQLIQRQQPLLKELEQLRGQTQQLEGELQNAKAGSQDQRQQLAQSLEQSRTQVLQLQKDLQYALSTERGLLEQRQELVREVETLRAQLSQTTAEMPPEWQSDKVRLEQELQHYQGRIDQLERSLDQFQADDQALQEMRILVGRLQSDNDQLKADLEAAQDASQQKDPQLTSLRSDLEHANQQIQRLQRELQELQQKLLNQASLETKIRQLFSENQQLQDDLDDTRKRYQQGYSALHQQQAHYEQQMQQQASLETQIQQLSTQNRDLQQDLGSTRAQLEEQQHLHHAQETQLRTVLEASAHLSAELLQAQQQLNHLNHELECRPPSPDQDPGCAALRLKYAQASELLVAYRQSLEMLQDEMQELRNRNRLLHARIEQQSSVVDLARTELRSSKSLFRQLNTKMQIEQETLAHEGASVWAARILSTLQDADLLDSSMADQILQIWTEKGGELTRIIEAYTGLQTATIKFFSDGGYLAKLLGCRRIGEYLQAAGLVTDHEIQEALEQVNPGLRLGETLVQQGLVRHKTAEYFATHFTQKGRIQQRR